MALKSLKTVRELASYLELRDDQVKHYAYGRGRSYRSFRIKKRHGGFRTIREPIRGLKIIQEILKPALDALYRPSSAVHGFTCGRSIATNAQEHVGCTWVFNLDLRDFFPSINFGRVRGLLIAKPYGISPPVATVIAQLCTYGNELPQGSPTSPVLSNMVAAKMDGQLSRLARRYSCTYTRYADDLTISTNRKSFPRALGYWDEEAESSRVSRVGDRLRSVVVDNGFRVNDEKVRLQRADERQVVTGLVVNEVVNLPRRFIRRIRAMLHAWAVHGHDAAGSEHFLRFDNKDRPRDLPRFSELVKGHIDFLGMVRGKDHPWYRTFLREYSRLDPDFEERPPHLQKPNHLRTWRDAIWVIETEEQQGTAFELAGLGLVTCAHILPQNEGDVFVYHPRAESLRHPVQVVKVDTDQDLALLELEASSGVALEPKSGDPPKNSEVMAAGYPGHAPGATLWEERGTVTGSRMSFQRRRLVVSFPIRAGASGAPVMDLSHRVVGIAAQGVENHREAAENPAIYGVIPVSVLLDVFK